MNAAGSGEVKCPERLCAGGVPAAASVSRGNVMVAPERLCLTAGMQIEVDKSYGKIRVLATITFGYRLSNMLWGPVWPCNFLLWSFMRLMDDSEAHASTPQPNRQLTMKMHLLSQLRSPQCLADAANRYGD